MKQFSKAFRSDWLVGLCFSLVLVLPLLLYSNLSHRILAPVNLLSECCGWQWGDAKGSFRTPVPSDVTEFVLPDRVYLKEAFSHHQIPLWDPSLFGGETFLANTESKVFHPINLLLPFFDLSTVQNLATLLSLFFACWLSFLLLRELGVSRLGSSLGAASYSLSNFMVFWAPFGMMTWVLATLPGLILLYLRWKRTSNFANLGFLSLLLGLEFYFGHIQFAFMAYVILGLIFVYDLLLERTCRSVHHIIPIIMAVMGGLLIGSAQILPFLAQASIGHRASSSFAGFASWARISSDLSNYLAPTVLRNTPVTPFLFSIGLIPAILSVIAIIKTTRISHRPFFVFIFCLGLLWSWGGPPQHQLALIIHQFKQLNPQYFLALAIFSGSMLAGFGLDDLKGILKPASKNLKEVSLEWLQQVFILAWWTSMLILGFYILRFGIHQRVLSANRSLALTVVILALAVVAYVTATSKFRRGMAMSTLVLLVAANGVILLWSINPDPPKELISTGNPYFEIVIRDAGQSNHHNVRIISPFNPNSNMYYGLSVLNGYDALYAADTEQQIDAINYPETPVKYSAISHNDVWISNVSKTNVLRNLGVEYVIASGNKVVPGYHEIFADVKRQMIIWKSDLPAGQVFLADSSVHVSREDQLKSIKDDVQAYHQVQTTNPQLVTKLVSLENRKVSYYIDVNKIEVSTASPQREVLVVGQTFRPEWRATIDGKPTRVFRVNYNEMAIQVTPGSHRIEFQYRSKWFELGMVLSLFSLIGAVLVVVKSRFGQN